MDDQIKEELGSITSKYQLEREASMSIIAKELDKLRDIGLEKISEETHISMNKLEAILNQDYAEFDIIFVTGLISILEREYKVDLGEWIKECKNYHGINNITTIVNVKPKNKNIVNKLGKKYYAILAISSLVIICFYLFSSNNNPTPSNLPEADSKIKDIEQANNAQAVSNLIIKQIEELNKSSEIAINELNHTNKIIPKPEKIKKDPKLLYKADGEMVSILPSSQLWVGITYLDNKTRKSQIIQEQLDLNISREQVIIFGHEKFKILGTNAQIQASRSSNTYHYSPDIGLLLIDQATYEALNGGIW